MPARARVRRRLVAERIACDCLEEKRLDHPALPYDVERARIHDGGECGDGVLRSALIDGTGGGHDPYLCSVAPSFVEVGEFVFHGGDVPRAKQRDKEVPSYAQVDLVRAREHLGRPFSCAKRRDGRVVPATDELESPARRVQHDGGRWVALGTDPAHCRRAVQPRTSTIPTARRRDNRGRSATPTSSTVGRVHRSASVATNTKRWIPRL
jgi:hypothetical protein